MKRVAGLLTGGRLHTQVNGLENVPTEGPALLAARHYHHLYDGVALYQTVPRELHILVTLDWATSNIMRFVMESAIRLAHWPLVLRPDAVRQNADGIRPQKNSVFSEKDIARYQRRALRDAVALLVKGEALLIFPEGYPNIDPNYTPKKSREEWLPFNAGFAVIAASATRALGQQIPIVPVGLNYLENRRWIARLNFGPALYAGDFPQRQTLVAEVEKQVKKLSSLPSWVRATVEPSGESPI